MKKTLLFAWALFTAFAGLCQNTFPNPGNVGIGTLTPEHGFLLDVNGLGTIGTQNSARLYLGTSDSGNAFIQARNSSINQGLKFFASSYSFDVGNVGIGIADPTSRKLKIVTSEPTNDVGVEVEIARTSGTNYGFIGKATGAGANTNIGLFTTATGGTSNFGLRIYNIQDAENSYAIYSDSPAQSYLQGNLGIGTLTPQGPLHVRGTSNAFSGSRNGLILDNANAAGNTASSIIWAANGVSKWEMGNDIGANGNQSFYLFDMENTIQPRFFINASGNIGIGTASPDSKLAVNGKIRAHEIKVETANWPDYVFAKSYQLPTLLETEKHIKEKGHLQGIPSATEVKANGVDLGEMNAKLLQKIEELTLHLIEMKKEINALKKTK